MRRSFVFASALVSILATAGVASADGPEPSNAPATANEKPQKPSDDSDFKSVMLGINPLGVAIGRYSIEGQYLPAQHHALTLNPFFVHTGIKGDVTDAKGNTSEADLGSLTGFGGELGYKFYTGSKGPSGFYVGPSLILAHYNASAPSGVNAADQSFTSYGAAIDIGGQGIVGPGIVIGGGFGLQYTKTSSDFNTDNLNLASAAIAGGGVRPRFLFTLAYAF